MSTSSIRIRPLDGESRPAINPNSVDLPLPDGPVIATTRPGVEAEIQRMEDREHRVAAGNRPRNTLQLDHEPPAASTIGRKAVQSVSATIRVPSMLGWMPSDWFSVATPATLSSMKGTKVTR